jgi:hypothetical protein
VDIVVRLFLVTSTSRMVLSEGVVAVLKLLLTLKGLLQQLLEDGRRGCVLSVASMI